MSPKRKKVSFFVSWWWWWYLGMMMTTTNLRCLAYDFGDPQGSHTSMAIRFDEEGRYEESRRAFEAAARYTPNTLTLVNLGVCLMRLGSGTGDRRKKVNYYSRSRDAMDKGKDMAVNREDDLLYQENWDALMTNFDLEDITYVAEEPEMCGVPQDPHEVRREDLREAKLPKIRPFLTHQREVPLAPELPKIHVGDLDTFRRYKDRRDPFVLQGAMDGWRNASLKPWTFLDDVATWFPRAVVDMYPYNMLSKTRQSPYLTRLPRAITELALPNGDPTSKFQRDPTAKTGRYLHLQLTPAMWVVLENQHVIPAQRHSHLHNDAWLLKCLDDSDVLEEYHIKTHWKVLLAGAKGAGMFNHSDTLQTSSWHAHLAGEKWWYLCGRPSDDPGGGRTRCFETILQPGDILYYGTGWMHETQNLATPTITLTDTAVHRQNFHHVADMLHRECAYNHLDFKFSAALCDNLDKCFTSLYDTYGGGDDDEKKKIPTQEANHGTPPEKRAASQPWKTTKQKPSKKQI